MKNNTKKNIMNITSGFTNNIDDYKNNLHGNFCAKNKKLVSSYFLMKNIE